RKARRQGTPGRRRPHHARLDGHRLRAEERGSGAPGVRICAVNVVALSSDDTLLILKLAFLVLLYGFIVLIVRSATKDIGGAPQESIVLGAPEAAALRAQYAPATARFVVLAGRGLERGSTVEVTASAFVGRGTER